MLRVSLLGEQVIADDATGTVRSRSSRTVLLLAYLALHANAPQTRQHLAGVFWPDSADAQALTNLRRELHHLRQLLPGEPALEVTPRDLCWRDSPTCRVDLLVFQRLRAAGDASAALAEYRGEFLPGAYDEWIVAPRARLERECVALCDRVAETGEPAEALAAARRRVELAPLEETGYRTLMRLQAEAGDRAGAVSTYHRCASVLDRELGIEPDEDTRAMLRQLVSRPAAPDRSRAELVGRARELDVLRERWRAAAAGHAGLVLVRGDAGVGKTRLLSELAALARHEGAVVATAESFGTSRQLPLAPVADWLRTPAVRAATATLDPVWRAEVDRLVPASADPARAMVDAWQRHRFLEGLARALTAVDRPLLLILDNLQWADEETLAFLPFYLGVAADRPVLVAGTVRSDDRGRPEWTAGLRTTELTLGPLDAAGTGRLAAAISGRALSADDAALLHATTGGFPLYVVEAARGTAAPGRAPAAVLRDRLDQVSAPAREIAGLAAAVGRDFTLQLLVEAADCTPDEVVEAVDELWRRRILREARDGYDFSHDLLRDTAYGLVSPPRRWLLHRRLAQALELLHDADTDAVSAQLAHQYALGGGPDRAVAYYRRAADVAASRFAHVEAIRLHRDALAILRTRPEGSGRDATELDVLEAMAAPLNARYGYSSAELLETLQRSLPLAERIGRHASVVTALTGLFASQYVRGEIEAGHRTATRLLAMVEPDSDLAGSVHFAYGGSALALGRPREAVEHFGLLATLVQPPPSLSIGTRPDVHGTAWSTHAYWLLGDEAGTEAARAGAIALARAVGHPYNLAVALAYGAITAQLRDDRAGLEEVAGELRALCDRYEFAYYREWALILTGWGARDPEPIRRGIGRLREMGALARMPYWQSLLADVLGRTDEAAAVLDAAIADAYARQDVWWLPEVLRQRAALDEPATAVARLERACALAREHGSVALLRRCERDLAAFAARPPAPNVLRTPAS